jgi:4'-phosphopantetheinyl transferase
MDSFIHCYIDSPLKGTVNISGEETEVFFGLTNDLSSRFPDIDWYLSEDERSRAEKFLRADDRNTYISCHGLLRSILSKKIHIDPLAVTYHYDIKNKPQLLGNEYFFNISHTRDAFAFIVSDAFDVGIDIEKIDSGIDLFPLVKSFFSEKEQKFVFSGKELIHDRFTLLWTRKEALLKAIGIGIVDNLAQIDVSEQINIIPRQIFDTTLPNKLFNEIVIFSEKFRDYYISMATPKKTIIKMSQINSANIISYIDESKFRSSVK